MRTTDRYGVEDPRVTEVGGTYYLTYSGWDRQHALLCLATSRDLRSWVKHGPLFPGFDTFQPQGNGTPGPWSKAGGILPAKVGEHYLMFFGEGSVWSATSTDLLRWTPTVGDTDPPLMAPRPGTFSDYLVEVGPPPLVTDDGLILLVHNAAVKHPDGSVLYTAGQALIHPDRPEPGPRRAHRAVDHTLDVRGEERPRVQRDLRRRSGLAPRPVARLLRPVRLHSRGGDLHARRPLERPPHPLNLLTASTTRLLRSRRSQPQWSAEMITRRSFIAGTAAVAGAGVATVATAGSSIAQPAVATETGSAVGRLTNLAHLRWLFAEVPLARSALHTTANIGNEPSGVAPWTYANALPAGGWTRVGGGSLDPTTGYYAQGAFNADDIARAAVVLVRSAQAGPASGRSAALADARQLLRTLTYLQDASGPNAGDVALWMQADGTLNLTPQPEDSPNPSDSAESYWLARTVWALGEAYAVFAGPHPDFAQFLQDRLHLSLDALDRGSLAAYGTWPGRRRRAGAGVVDHRRRRRHRRSVPRSGGVRPGGPR